MTTPRFVKKLFGWQSGGFTRSKGIKSGEIACVMSGSAEPRDLYGTITLDNCIDITGTNVDLVWEIAESHIRKRVADGSGVWISHFYCNDPKKSAEIAEKMKVLQRQVGAHYTMDNPNWIGR